MRCMSGTKCICNAANPTGACLPDITPASQCAECEVVRCGYGTRCSCDATTGLPGCRPYPQTCLCTQLCLKGTECTCDASTNQPVCTELPKDL
jgi:hypothetical protein